MSKNNEIDMIKPTFLEKHFKLDEAVNLLYLEAIRNEDSEYLPNPPFEKTGTICGIVTMNDFIEVLVKYPEGILQLNKAEFFGFNQLVPDRMSKH
jgi:hypothetical protein